MNTKFKIGDNVSWNSEAGKVSGSIIKIHTKDFNFKGYTHLTLLMMNLNMK
jgi:hypothetical protein